MSAAAQGESVAAESWAAAIPVQLRLADSEVSSLEQPAVLYMLVPRQSYLHSLVPQALQALQHLLPPGQDTPWFEHGHLPLKWSVPAGVLYDLVAAPSGELPWRLTIHFRGFPDRMLPAYGGEAALRGAFFFSLKEAAVVCRGSAQRVMEMAAGAQEDLFRQALAASLPRYASVLASLQLAPTPQRGGPPRLPLRLYVRLDAGGYLSSYKDIISTSRPAPALAPDGSPTSLRQALLPLVEECLRRHGSSSGGGAGPVSMAASQSLPATPVARSSSTGAERGVGASATADAELPPASEASEGSAADAGSSAAGAPAAAAAGADAAAQAAAQLEAAAAGGRVLVGGACPPLDAPLAWLHARLHAPDFHLYCVLHLAPGPS